MRAVTAALCAILCLLAISMRSSVAALEPYEVNVVLSMSGQGAFLGKEQAEALKVLEQYVNRTGGIQGHPLQFAVQDDQSTPAGAVQLTQGLIAKKVPVILGPTLISTCNAMAALASAGPVIFCTSPAVLPVTDTYVFSSGASVKDLIDTSVRYMREHGLTRFALIATTDAGGEDAVKWFTNAANQPENKSVTLVDTERFNVTDLSVAAQVAHIRTANPQAIVLWTAGTPFGTFLRALKDSGLQLPVITAVSAASVAGMQQWASLLPSSLSLATVPALAANAVKDRATKRQVDGFLAEMRAAGVKVDYVSTTVWDPGLLIVDALRKLGINATSTQIRDQIANLKGWVGADGPYDFVKFPNRGLGAASLYVSQWDAAKEAWVGISGPGGAILR